MLVSGFFSAIMLAILNIYLSGHGFTWQDEYIRIVPFFGSALNLIFTGLTLGGGLLSGSAYLLASKRKENDVNAAE